jgi:hypothetical protein
MCRVSKDTSKTGPPVKSVSFVYSCDTNDLKKAKTGLMDAINLFFMVVKKQNMNPIGSFLLHYLKDSLLGLENTKIWLLKRLPTTLTNIFLGDIHYIGMSLACEL